MTLRLALRHALEIVGIAEAAAVEEMPATLTAAVKEVASHQPATGTRSFVQVTRVLII